MIEHIKILSFLLTLIFSIWVLSYIYQTYKSYSYKYLLSLCWYTIVTNLGFLFILIYAYVNINLLENAVLKNDKTLILISDIFISLFGIGLFYFMLQILLEFRAVYIKKKYKWYIILSSLFITICYVVRHLAPSISKLFGWLTFLRIYLFENIIILEIIIITLSIFINYKQKEKNRLFKSFSLLYISRYILTIIIILFIVHSGISESFKLILGFLVLFYYNLVPFLWIKLFFLNHAQQISEHVAKNSQLTIIFEKYNISKRESEIIKLILDGKTNNEIKDQLFISFHTVKNHIYSIYSKLDVKNRHELTHFFLNQI